MADAQAPEPTQLRLLGRFSLLSGSGAEAPISAPRQRALIAFLALQPDFAANREQLATLLWDDTDERYARQNLRQIISRLRRELKVVAPDFIIADRELVRIGALNLHVDVRAFERAASISMTADTATALYRGDFLEGFSCGAQGFDEWAEQKRSRLRMIYRAIAPSPAANFFENVPPRDLNFTGREISLEALHSLLNSADAAADRPVAIHGLGGMGKSSLAAEYVRKYADAYGGVCWINAARRTSLVGGLATLATRIDPRFSAVRDEERAAALGLEQLSHFGKPFLLIYDDVESPETIAGLLPSSGARVIITSRWADWAGYAAPVRLDALDEDAAVEFLQKRAGRSDSQGAKELSRALGHLPLALDHAGAYCRLTASSFAAYLRQIDLRVARAPKGVARPTSTAATFGLAIDAAARQHPQAEALLASMAYLASDGIPISVVAGTSLDKRDRDGAIAALSAVSLIDCSASDRDEITAAIHPLVQVAMRNRLAERNEVTATLAQITTSLAQAFPASAITDPKTWPVCGALLKHVLALREFDRWSAGASAAASRLLHGAGAYLYIRTAFRDAETLLREAITIGETAFAPDHPVLVQERFDFGRMLFFTGRIDEAEALFRLAIAEGEKALGRDHIDVADRLCLLAELLNHTKRYVEGEAIFREIIAVADRREDSKTPHDVAWRNAFGLLLVDCGRLAEAESVYRDALRIAEKKLGREHHEVARAMNNLGATLRRMERYEEAEPLVREAVAIWTELLHAKDAYLARGQHNLAFILHALGRSEEALPLAEQALATQEDVLGVAHFWTVDSARTCAWIFHALGRIGEAGTLRARFNLQDELQPRTEDA
ncbi:tetratricopeptide repeat protein [Terrarubrum flagellatum]|uniref:tetratricopeptide repeat protein n=1 Tax=Terrirubrum flagellatum TaxID=2895980 RepID=UPI0031453066